MPSGTSLLCPGLTSITVTKQKQEQMSPLSAEKGAAEEAVGKETPLLRLTVLK